MFFGRKKQDTKQDTGELMHARLLTIPEVFYGGKDPEIYHHKAPSSGVVAHDKDSSTQKKHIIGGSVFFSSRKALWILGISLFILVVAGISWYYLRDVIKPTSQETQVVQTPIPDQNNINSQIEQNSEQTTTPEVEIETPTPLNTTSSMPSLTSNFLEYPLIQYGSTADMDMDELTDVEEEVYGTDPGKWDTDGDGYYDGQELVNLYNPAGVAPMRLIDSGLAKEYINNKTGYRVYYPSSWQKGSVDAQENQVLFSALDGDFVEIRVMDKQATTSFLDWFGQTAKGEQASDLLTFTNRFNESGWKRKDGLVAYFVADSYVFIIIYHQASPGPILYRHVMSMAVQSFRAQKTQIDIPNQPIIPMPVDVPVGSGNPPRNSNTSTPSSTPVIIL